MNRSAAASHPREKNFAQEIERRVAERTAELTALNEQLGKELAERKRTEEALREGETNFQLIVDSIPAQVAVITPTGEVVTLNQPCLDYFGRTFEDLKGWASSDSVHPEDLAHVIDVLKHALETGETYEVESRHRRFDGVYRWFHVRGFPLKDTDGTILRWCVLLTDIDDRKRSELLLRESELLFKTIFDEAGAGIALLDLKAEAPIRNNRALQKMLDCTEDELGRIETFEHLTHEDEREKDSITFRELCAGQCDSLRLEKHFVLKDGRSIWANVIFTLLRDDQGKPRYVIAIHEGITERKRVLETLQAQQDLLALAQKAARAMAFDWYIQQEINIWSPEQEALYGLPPGGFDGRYLSWKKMIHAVDWPSVVDSIKHAHETGEVAAEFRVMWPDGRLHWLSTIGRMFFDDNGEPLRMVGFTSDITRRKLVEEELRRSEAFLAQAQQLSRTGSFSWRIATDEITWSDQMYRIYEFKIGVPVTLELIRTRVHPEDTSLIEKMKIVHETGGDTDFEWRWRLIMPDGAIKYLHAVANVTLDQNGELEYIAAVQDVTRRRLSEVALDKARSELAHVSRVMSLGALTASIAHEVNQPLSGIITNASTCVRMLDANPPNVEGARETAKRTIRDAHRAADVITRLRALFGRKDAITELVDLNEATREVIALSRTELERNRVITRTELAAELPLVTGDRVQLQQVILNLLRNGSDAMSDVNDRPRELLFRTEVEEGNCAYVSVRDAGVGFEPQTLERLFQSFYTTKADGMGIGLSVSRSIIENHRGRIWATPNDGPGVTFSFSIPCADDAGESR